jgi:hypothetical protein
MQPHRAHLCRRVTRKSPSRSIASLAFLSALTLTVATACTSSGGSSSGSTSSNSLGFGSPAATIPATPPDVPSGSPGCSAPLDQAVTVPPALQNLVSACADAAGDKVQVTNLSQLVLDIAPAAGTGDNLIPMSYDVSSGPLPTLAGELEVEAENAVVAGQLPAIPHAVLLPVGGTVMASTTDPPVQLTVGEDAGFSRRSFEAVAWASYIVTNIPGESPANYYQTIADCVNDSYDLWNALKQKPPPSLTDLLLKSINAYDSCNELREKVKEYLESKGRQESLEEEAQLGGEHADESNWDTEYMREEQLHEDITDLR